MLEPMLVLMLMHVLIPLNILEIHMLLLLMMMLVLLMLLLLAGRLQGVRRAEGL